MGLVPLAKWFLDKAFPNEGYVESTRAWLAQERRWMLSQLENIPELRVVPSDANFILLCVLSPTKKDLTSSLALQGIYVRSGSEFRGLDANWIRAAILDRNRNQQLLLALKSTVKG